MVDARRSNSTKNPMCEMEMEALRGSRDIKRPMNKRTKSCVLKSKTFLFDLCLSADVVVCRSRTLWFKERVKGRHCQPFETISCSWQRSASLYPFILCYFLGIPMITHKWKIYSLFKTNVDHVSLLRGLLPQEHLVHSPIPDLGTDQCWPLMISTAVMILHVIHLMMTVY